MNLTDNKQEKCVMARILRKGERHQRNFTLKQYGTWTAARAAAEKWVAAQLANLPRSRQNEKGRMTWRNHSGEVGVYLGRSVAHRPNDREYEYFRWTARWPGCPFKGGVGWSVLMYGDNEAFALAVVSRRMETANRQKVQDYLKSIRGSKEHREIMALKKAEAPV